jgi:hypothetical protein
MLSNKGVPAFRNRMLTLAVQSLEQQIDNNNLPKGLNKKILVQFLSSAAVGVLEWWINNSMPFPSKEMVEQLSLLIKQLQLAKD